MTHLDDAVHFLQDGLQIEKIAIFCTNKRGNNPIPLSSALARDILSTEALTFVTKMIATMYQSSKGGDHQKPYLREKKPDGYGPLIN